MPQQPNPTAKDLPMVKVLVHHAEQGTIRLLYDKSTSANLTNPTTTNSKQQTKQQTNQNHKTKACRNTLAQIKQPNIRSEKSKHQTYTNKQANKKPISRWNSIKCCTSQVKNKKPYKNNTQTQNQNLVQKRIFLTAQQLQNITHTHKTNFNIHHDTHATTPKSKLSLQQTTSKSESAYHQIPMSHFKPPPSHLLFRQTQ